jgi:hypothetical protein
MFFRKSASSESDANVNAFATSQVSLGNRGEAAGEIIALANPT